VEEEYSEVIFSFKEDVDEKFINSVNSLFQSQTLAEDAQEQ